MKGIFKKWNSISLVTRIIIGIILGIIFALAVPEQLSGITILGSLFVGALKAVAPILVFLLVINAIASHKSGKTTNMKTVLILYAISTFSAALVAVLASYMFPTKLTLVSEAQDVAPPSGISEVLQTLLHNMVTDPITAMMSANFLGVLTWALLLGFALRAAQQTTIKLFEDLANAITQVVQWVISLAPIGIMGIVFEVVSTTGLTALTEYGRLIAVLVGTMLVVALIINPIIVYASIRRNPFPLVFTTLRESGITAFFTRSSAANIPVNMNLAKKLQLNKDTYAISIPLGATINMAGAAITISVLSMATAHTLGIEVDIFTAVILMVLSAVSAAGASGVAGGSLLLIPLATGLLGIGSDIAMQVVAIGFIIGVIQDSCETALNSSSDILFTATAEYAQMRKENK